MPNLAFLKKKGVISSLRNKSIKKAKYGFFVKSQIWLYYFLKKAKYGLFFNWVFFDPHLRLKMHAVIFDPHLRRIKVNQ
jgi:hypothetical protein